MFRVEKRMTFYIVMRLREWADVELTPPFLSFPLTVPPEFGKYFCTVFERREEAEKYAGGYPVVEVKGSEKPENERS